MSIQKHLKSQFEEYWLAITITLLIIVGSLLLHLKAGWSPMMLNPDQWISKLDLHLNWPPFAIRYFQSYATIAFHRLSGLPMRESFYTVQYILVLLLGPLFYNFLKRLGINKSWSLAGMIMCLTSFPVFGAHLAPVHTWDDIWLYLFSVITFSYAIQRKWYAAALAFTLGCFAREQMLIFYPIFLLAAYWLENKRLTFKMILPLLFPLVFYSIFRLLVWEDIDPRRWELLSYNFANPGRVADSTVSIFLVFGFLWVPLIVAYVKRKQLNLIGLDHLCLWGVIMSVPLTMFVAICFTFVRETRIMFPPFLFVIPLALTVIIPSWRIAVESWSPWTWLGATTSVCILVIVGLQVAKVIWPYFDYNSSHLFRQQIAGVHLGLSVALLIFITITSNPTFCLLLKKKPPI